MNLQQELKHLDEPTRRHFIASVAGACLGVTLLPHVLEAATGQKTSKKAPRHRTSPSGHKHKRKRPVNVIYLYMAGGMSHLDTFDPKPGQDVQGPTEVIGTDLKKIQLSSHLTQIAKHIDKLAIIRGMSSKQGAHEQANYLMHTAYPARGTILHPSLGSWIMKLQHKTNPRLPGNIVIGSGYLSSGFLATRLGPLLIGDPNKGLQNSHRPTYIKPHEFDQRLKLAARLDRAFSKRYRQEQVRAYNDMYNDAIRLMKSKDLDAFDLGKEPQPLRQAYGHTPFGQGCLLARRLVERDVRFVEVSLGGWDMHDDLFNRMDQLAGTLDQAMSALLADLAQRQLLDHTLVVLATEFGRTPKINGNKGRDHHPKAFTCAMAGAGVRGGSVIGQTSEQGDRVESGKVSIADFNATLAKAVGLPLNKVVHSPSGRPFTVANKGKPLDNILSV